MRAAARRVAIAGSVLGVAMAGTVLTSVAASASTTYIVDNTNPSVLGHGVRFRYGDAAVLHAHHGREQGSARVTPCR